MTSDWIGAPAPLGLSIGSSILTPAAIQATGCTLLELETILDRKESSMWIGKPSGMILKEISNHTGTASARFSHLIRTRYHDALERHLQ
jgi:hypothetical protein